MRSVAALIPNIPAEMWAIVETVVAVVKVQTAGAAWYLRAFASRHLLCSLGSS